MELWSGRGGHPLDADKQCGSLHEPVACETVPVFYQYWRTAHGNEQECPLQVRQAEPRVRGFEGNLRDEEQDGQPQNRFTGHRC